LSFSYRPDGLLASVTDPDGRRVSYGWDTSQNLVSVTDAGGSLTRFIYDGSHRLTSMTTPNGGISRNVYDGSSRVVSQTDPSGRTLTFSYGASTTTITDGNGHQIAQSYSNNRLTALTRGVGSSAAATWNFTYDAAGNRNSGTDPNGHTWHATYDARGNRLSFVDALGRVTSTTYNLRNDPLVRTDALGVAMTYSYDSKGNLTSRSRPLSGTSQTWTETLQYGDATHPGDVTTFVDAAGAAWAQSFDTYGNVIRRVDPDGDTWTGNYNGIGWLTGEVTPRGNSAGNPTGFTISYLYSAVGQVLQKTDQLGHATKFSYDANRNLIGVADANGHLTQFAYDPDNRLVKTTRADGTVLTTSFDAAGNMIAQSDGLGETTGYSFDALNRRIAMIDPLGRITQFGYDGSGNRVSEINASNQLSTMSYDAANELVGITYGDGHTPAVHFTYDLDGQRASMQDGTGISAYRFDSLHRLTGVSDGAGNSVGYGYDLRGDLVAIVYPSGKVVTRGFDSAGRLVTVTDWLGNTSHFRYDPDGNLVNLLYGNGVKGVFGYDGSDRVISMDYGALRFSYSRDNLGLVTRADTRDGEEDDRYTYDSLNQLSAQGPESFAYDPADNITKLDFGALSYDAANEVVRDTSRRSRTLTYDARGNRLSAWEDIQYRYDQENRLTGIGPRVSYSYNGDGLRTGKVVSGAAKSFTWDQAQGLPLLLSDSSAQFIYGAQRLPLEQIGPDGHVLWLHHDQLGSTRVVSDRQGRIVGRYAFGGYGQRRGEDQSDGDHQALTPLLFAGEYTDPESGLLYLRSRYYDPGTGQFLTRDPKAPVTRTPYLYASGDPVNHTDPSGEQEADVNPGPDPAVNTGATTGSNSGGGDPGVGSCPIDPSNFDKVAGIFDSINGYFSSQQQNPDDVLNVIDQLDPNHTNQGLQKLRNDINALRNTGIDEKSYEFNGKLKDVYKSNSSVLADPDFQQTFNRNKWGGG
jgi:RHS repeat-associated protein